jgi:hypothetical protein
MKTIGLRIRLDRHHQMLLENMTTRGATGFNVFADPPLHFDCWA